MRRPSHAALLLLVPWATIAAASAARGQAVPTHKPELAIVRYISARKGKAWGRPALLLTVAPRKAIGSMELAVPNRNPRKNKFDPPPDVARLVKELKQGDLLVVKTTRYKGENALNFIKPCRLNASDDDGEALLFVRLAAGRIGRRRYLGVVVQYDRKPELVLIPNRKDKAGKTSPDKALAEQAKTFSEGDVVRLEVEKIKGRAYLKRIERFYPPLHGQFVKLVQARLGEEVHLCLSFQGPVGPPKLLPIPNVRDADGKTTPEPALAAAAKELKPGQRIRIYVRMRNEVPYLRRIAPVQKPAEQDRPKDQPKPKRRGK